MFTPMDAMGKTNMMLDLIAQRQRAIGSNIANIDTPGYVRRDINFSEYLSTMNSPLETKLSEALGPSGLIEERHYEEIDPVNEIMSLNQNSTYYTMATRRMSNIITAMKTVINVGK